MRDLLGYRRMLGIVTPADNTVAIADFCRVSLTGVTVHQSDYIDPRSGSPATLLASVRDGLTRMACKAPGEVALLTDDDFAGDEDAALGGLAAASGHPDLIVPSNALAAAAACFDRAKRFALVTSFPTSRHELAILRVKSLGISVVADATTCFEDSRSAAQTTYVVMRELYDRAVAQADVDVVIQLGHNLPMARQVENLEEDHGRPILAINTVCLWHMLRRCGIQDSVPGHGMLLMDH